MSKVYDHLEWSCVEFALRQMGFTVHGGKFVYLQPQRGIQQGDPISSYLFIICSEMFSLPLQDAEIRGVIQGIAVARETPRVSHLLFADNSSIFCKATEEAMTKIGAILGI
ncbi:putative mitochondrial protein [Sesamum angolense]|uniref:Mitochondrial protein n=1 Tax=Sesamum angolense TaxID=2727404 RepID=A0AAE1X390_9LAMI|nr:putative mitochondrial protein [Sesamum angolense]